MNPNSILQFRTMKFISHNYSIVRLDRNRCGGGVALYIKNTLPYLERKDLVSDNLEMIYL
jgi:hypothetical protein